MRSQGSDHVLETGRGGMAENHPGNPGYTSCVGCGFIPVYYIIKKKPTKG